MNCYCYYQNIGLEYPEKLMQRWKTSFESRGFSTQVLELADAEKHPAYAELKQIISEIPTINGPGFDAACFTRWLAFEKVTPGLFTDYDMINYSLTPEQVPTGDMINLNAMCIYATKEGLTEFINRIRNYRLYLHSDTPYLSDLDLFVRSYTGVTYPLCDCAGLPSEMTKPVVHFGNGYVKPEWRHNNRWLAVDELTQRRTLFEAT